MLAGTLKKQVKEVGSEMAGGFYQSPVKTTVSYYKFSQEGDIVSLHLTLNAAGKHHHRDRQRFARLVSAVLYATGLKGKWQDDGSFGFNLKSGSKKATAKKAA